jgi:hypothetical protein
VKNAGHTQHSDIIYAGPSNLKQLLHQTTGRFPLDAVSGMTVIILLKVFTIGVAFISTTSHDWLELLAVRSARFISVKLGIIM